MSNPFQVVRDFESALCEYTGARYAVTVTSCTSALLLACAWFANLRRRGDWFNTPRTVSMPKRTYVSVAQSVRHAGWVPEFRDEVWEGGYQLNPLPVWDFARRFTSGMYTSRQFQCVSFHHSKILALAAHGGAILHDNDEADDWLRRARFDGRQEGVDPVNDPISVLGWHCYMTPPTAAEGLMRLSVLPKHNADLPNSDYKAVSTMEWLRYDQKTLSSREGCSTSGRGANKGGERSA